MIQDIQPKQFTNTYSQKEPQKDSALLHFQGNDIFLKQEDVVKYPTYEQVVFWCAKENAPIPRMVWLFSIEGTDYFLADLPEAFIKEAGKEGYTYVRMFLVREGKPKEKVFAAATAWHLYVWYRDNRFCGRCGEKTVHSDVLRMLKCPVCQNMIYPKIAPAVIVGVTDGEHILMTKYAGREYKRYALIAGFTEIGETAEETVRREVFEEVGLKVKNIHYYKSQPWGFDQNLLLGYFCELDDTAHIRLDEEELACAEWVNYQDISDDTEGLSLTREMMTVFRDQVRKRKNKE